MADDELSKTIGIEAATRGRIIQEGDEDTPDQLFADYLIAFDTRI
jgi:hypothetical protein